MQKLKKIGKITGIIVLSLVLVVTVWANWDAHQISEDLPKIDIAIFDAANVGLTNQDQLIAELSSTEGVTACSYHENSKLITMTYQIEKLEKQDLESKINQYTSKAIPTKVFDYSKNRCPVSGFATFKAQLRSAFRFR